MPDCSSIISSLSQYAPSPDSATLTLSRALRNSVSRQQHLFTIFLPSFLPQRYCEPPFPTPRLAAARLCHPTGITADLITSSITSPHTAPPPSHLISVVFHLPHSFSVLPITINRLRPCTHHHPGEVAISVSSILGRHTTHGAYCREQTRRQSTKDPLSP